jgi:hypothetical protein
VKVYRVVSGDESKWYKSNQFRGFYYSEAQAVNAIRHLRNDQFVYDAALKRYVKIAEWGWKVQEADLSWTDTTSST